MSKHSRSISCWSKVYLEQAKDTKDSVDDIYAVITARDYAYTLIPQKIFRTAKFVNKIRHRQAQAGIAEGSIFWDGGDMELKHLHIHVRDRTVAEQFYGQWFGLTMGRHGTSLTFMNDEAKFDLALMDDPSAQALPSWFHFGFRLATAEAVPRSMIE